MLKSVIHGDLRNQIGSNACHRIRNIGHVPAVVYGPNTNTRAIELDKREIDNIIRNYGTNVLFDLQVDNNYSTVIIKEIQRNPLTNEIRHIDLQEISTNKPIHTTVPIRLIGKEKVESSIGVVQQQLREANIECLPDRIPESIDIDISSLAPGNPLRIADVEFGEEISVLNEPYEVVAALTKTEKIVEATEEDDLLEKVIEVPKEIK
ncbi:50S ribosomal protein L25 [Crassaminicella indica]|uniref:Large ribosomal subunit protein bL25 n=1 Tax=Crassaminicella indica TaxID=2855394 RepID=A0ABX8RCU9_9CLOT|nr:50S ribosomal protein L25 [Crassaminicella indica]QXM06885.1 50S ribosomal protein L25 [Crassaminicella indica]